MSEETIVTPAETPQEACVFTLSGQEPDVVDGRIHVHMNRASKFKITIVPREGVQHLEEDDRIEIDLSEHYPASGSASRWGCLSVVKTNSTIGPEVDFDVDNSELNHGILAFRIGQSVRREFSREKPIVVSVALAEIEFDRMMISAPVRVSLKKGRNRIPLGKSTFFILGRRVSPADVELRIGSNYQNYERYSDRICLPGDVETFLDVAISLRAGEWGYAEIPALAEVLEMNFEGLLSSEELRALARCPDPTFRVSLDGPDKLRIVNALDERRIIRESALKLRLGPFRTSIYRNDGKDVAKVRLSFGAKSHVFERFVGVFGYCWERGISGPLRLSEPAKIEFCLAALILPRTTGIRGGGGEFVNFLEVDLDDMLSKEEVDQAIAENPRLKRAAEGDDRLLLSGRDGRSGLDLRLVFARSARGKKARGTLRVRAMLDDGQSAPVAFRETSFEVVGKTSPHEGGKIKFQSIPPGAPVVFARDATRPLCLEIVSEQDGAVRVPAEAPLARLDFAMLLSTKEVEKLAEGLPEKFKGEVRNSTLTLAPRAELILWPNEPVLIPLGTACIRDANLPPGAIKLSLLRSEWRAIDGVYIGSHKAASWVSTEVASATVPYEIRKIALSLAGKGEARNQTVRNERLYLNPKSKTAFDIEITLEGSPDSSIPVAQPGIRIDFGRALGAEDVKRIADQYPSGEFTATSIAATRSLVLTPKAGALTISSQSPVQIPIEIPPFELPESKPYGTILATLLHDGRTVAAEEFDVSIHQHDLDGSATPPVLVSWNNGTPPQLKVGTAGRCHFAIVNARCDRRGSSKPLVTTAWSPEDAGDPLKPRIRLSIPPGLRNSRDMVEFGEKDMLAKATIRVVSSKQHDWICEPIGKYQEMSQKKQNPHVLEKDEHLVVTVDKIIPQKAGAWSLVVTLVDFPGYSCTTFLLPIEVSG